MTKREMIRDIQARLLKAGYKITQKELSEAFPSKKGKFSRTLYGVYNSDRWTILRALKKRGVFPQEIGEIEFLQSPQWKSLRRQKYPSYCCQNCGYPDPQKSKASHCPNCDAKYYEE